MWKILPTIAALLAYIIGFHSGKSVVLNKIGAEVDSLEAKVEQLKSVPPDTVIIDPAMYINATITAYAPDSASCYPFNDGYTATMKDAKLPGVAVDPTRIPFGSIVVIDGVPYEADDTGQAMRDAKDIHIDLRFPTRKEALEFGKRKQVVEVILR